MARKGGVMWFHFCAANHDPIGRQTLGDMFAWFRAGLLDAGHKVTWHDTKTERGAVNIFWENFSPGWGKLLADSGITYGIVATEVPDGMGSFNWRNDSGWPQRFAAFGEVAERAAFIWETVESTVPFYGRFAKTAYLELGYSDRLLPIESMPDPNLDFSFFGLCTPYREQVAAELRQHFNFVWPDKFCPLMKSHKLSHAPASTSHYCSRRSGQSFHLLALDAWCSRSGASPRNARRN
jgi:hypothetical protein